MKVFAPRETIPGERRVAITPDSAARLRKAGVEVSVEHGAGVAASYDDAVYEASGAAVVANASEGYQGAGLVVKVQPPQLEEARAIEAGSAVLSFLQPGQQRALVDVFQERRITSFSLDLVPRISRAQSMDALSSRPP